jgi:hypothetical protein
MTTTMQDRKEEPCILCGSLTTDQWGGYCHDCDSYFEAVIKSEDYYGGME